MIDYDEIFRNELSKPQFNTTLRLHDRLVDDNTIIVDTPKMGQSSEMITETIAETIKCISNNIHPGIEVEIDTPYKHPNCRAPILEMEVWVTEEGKVMHNHYAKPMAYTGVVHPNSGLSSATKRLMIFNEGLRRLKSCHPELP